MKEQASSGIILIDRRTGEQVKETVFGDSTLKFVYETLLGRTLWGILFNSCFLSSVLGWFYDRPGSKKSIGKLASVPGCAPEEAEFPVSQYGSFNDFFTRKLKAGARPFEAEQNKLASPSDGRVLVYEDLGFDDPVPVKGAKRTIRELCRGAFDAERLAVAVVRLAPVDYHRYHFPCDCVQESAPEVFSGKYHSVNPVALVKRPDLYVENTRQITRLASDVFGNFCFIEVGAFGVGSIVQTSTTGTHFKQDEKGYFKFGGSTVILVFDNSKLKWSEDLLENSKAGFETLIRCGETIGFYS